MNTKKKFDRTKFMSPAKPGTKGPGAKPSPVSRASLRPGAVPKTKITPKPSAGPKPNPGSGRFARDEDSTLESRTEGRSTKPRSRNNERPASGGRNSRPHTAAGSGRSSGPAPRRGRGERRKDAHQSRSIEDARGPLHATVDKNRKGFAYLIPQGGWSKRDLFVAPHVARLLFPGDVVKIQLHGRIPREIHSIQDLALVEHRLNIVIGKAYPERARTEARKAPQKGKKAIGTLVWERKQNREEIPLYSAQPIDFASFEEGQSPFVQAKLVFPGKRFRSSDR